MSLPDRLRDVTLQHLLDLVEARAMETAELEFKTCFESASVVDQSELHGPPKNNTDDILQNIVAMANNQGGYIIVGAKESPSGGRDTIEKLVGLKDVSRSILKLKNRHESIVSPPLVNFNRKVIQLEDGGEVVVIKVDPSYHHVHGLKVDNVHFDYFCRTVESDRRLTPLEVNQMVRTKLNLEELIEAELDKSMDDLKRANLGRLRQSPESSFLFALDVIPEWQFSKRENLKLEEIHAMLRSSNAMGDIWINKRFSTWSLITQGLDREVHLFRNGKLRSIVVATCQPASPSFDGGPDVLKWSSVAGPGIRLLELVSYAWFLHGEQPLHCRMTIFSQQYPVSLVVSDSYYKDLPLKEMSLPTLVIPKEATDVSRLNESLKEFMTLVAHTFDLPSFDNLAGESVIQTWVEAHFKTQ